ncbi:terpenoid synthase [Laetiporus sulphureus 93-53]|uniref:Terpene synthase n=1 Tax=Laetiporus sulphureus 93-53 TaxID=1314785 RepID=A0A165DES2_9APHY|nr:terpenoid synthase [Laetiporus sulphureus 93-53]KZT04728.1 terpenoid synthase [Laetiporus sulphureus 93-53]
MSYCTKIIRLPDIMDAIPFPIRMNPYTRFLSAASDTFILASTNFTEKQRSRFLGLKAGLLCGMSYVESGPEKLRVCMDFTSFLFCLDDWSDEFNTTQTETLEAVVMNTLRYPEIFYSNTVAARITKSWWKRMLKNIGPRCKERFISSMDLYFKAITQQAADRASKHVSELDAYISLRRDTSGCKAGFVLIEYATYIDLPDEVYENLVVQDLMDAANDSVSWGNDIFSYSRERSRGDPHNLVAVIAHAFGIGQQAAVDHAAAMCNETVERFLACKAALPSWGRVVDAQVETFVRGLEDWMIANAEWSFVTERYFGKNAPQVRKSLRVHLLPVVNPL